MTNPMRHDVIIVGAGPAGIGCSLALRRAGIEKVLILEADNVGSSFRRWPKEMRLITPSFHGNPFFQTDLNSITPDTSPADFFQKEHLSGNEYADYLLAISLEFKLKLRENEKVLKIIPESDGYSVQTEDTTYLTNIVIWAGGEFSLPNSGSFTGAEYCVHSSVFRTWSDFQGDEALIIGGYESGIDAACHLIALGKQVVLLSSGKPWDVDHPDPSEVLSPYTRQRLLNIIKNHQGRFTIQGNSTVARVDRLSERYVVETEEGEIFNTKHRPIAAIGFQSALTPIKELFTWEGSAPQFTEEDESTLHSGLYYTGPSLVQRGTKFCFIYKFRARFGVIARSIAQRLGYPEPDLEDDRKRGFLVDDLECCTNCECAVESKAETLETPS
ncbi:MAG: NAD(P)/FAD-dependent oxidoreductase [Verrucomicrobiota bacterium]